MEEFIGFFGLINVLIGFDIEDKIIGFEIFESCDMCDYVYEVCEVELFWW